MDKLLAGAISRRQFVARLAGVGIATTAAGQMADLLAAVPSADRLILSDVSGGQITCETLKEWGVSYVFGNTGAYEAGFLDALVEYPDIHYVLGLHEGSAVAMADGYARISGRTAFVNVHSITGTANALGMIVNAWSDNSPIVITVGLSPGSGENLGIFTETARLESVPEPFTKLAFRSSRLDNLAESLRRAFRLASVHPSGPVFLGVTADVWSGKIAQAAVIPAERSLSRAKLPPDGDAVEAAAAMLASADNPLLIAGAELPRWGGLPELVKIADLLAATVSGDTAASRSSMGFPGGHPRYLGPLRQPIESKLPFDVVLLAGTSRFTLAGAGKPILPANAKIIELGIRGEHLARGYPADILLNADPGITLQRLLQSLKSEFIDRNRLETRRKNGRQLADRRRARLQENLKQVWDDDPIAPERLVSEIDRAIDSTAIVVTEAVSSDGPIWDYLRFDQPAGLRRHIISSGGSLGWGLGAGIGARLAAPDRQTVILVGDGSYQFGVQALWTASRLRTPLIIVIFNNRAYQANRWALSALDGRAKELGRYIGINLEDPEIDHVRIARAYGLEGERVTRPDALAVALQRAITAERRGQAYVLDVLIARRGGGAHATWQEAPSPGQTAVNRKGRS